MKRKIVSTRGRKRLAFSGPATLSARLRKNSMTASTAPWRRPGVSSIRRDTTNEMTARTAMVSQVATIVLVIEKSPKRGLAVIGSAGSWM